MRLTTESRAAKRARASLRTGVRPVGNELGLRCLLVARAPPGSNPPHWPDTAHGQSARCWTAQKLTVDRHDVNPPDGPPDALARIVSRRYDSPALTIFHG